MWDKPRTKHLRGTDSTGSSPHLHKQNPSATPPPSNPTNPTQPTQLTQPTHPTTQPSRKPLQQHPRHLPMQGELPERLPQVEGLVVRYRRAAREAGHGGCFLWHHLRAVASCRGGMFFMQPIDRERCMKSHLFTLCR